MLESLEASTYPNLEIIVVDDGSTDGTGDAIENAFPNVRILKGDGNLWWSGGTNLGVREALSKGAEYVLTLNHDNIVPPNFIEPLVERSLQERGALVSSKVCAYEDPSIVTAFGGATDWFRGDLRDICSTVDAFDYTQPREAEFLPGRSVLIPSPVFQRIGLFDQCHCPQYLGDLEFSLRAAKKGYRLFVEPRSVVWNKTSSATGTSCLDTGSIREIIIGKRSAFYWRANYFVYREYCPYRPFQVFLALRYARLCYSIFRRRFIDKTRR